MLDLEDEIKVFNFSPRVNAALLNKKVFFVKDVLALDRSLLGFSKTLSKEVIDKVHAAGYKFFYEYEPSEFMALQAELDEKANNREVIYIDNVTIYDMGFNARIVHALERAEVKNLYDLSQMNFYQLQRIRNLGASSLEKVINRIHSYGILLKNESIKNRKQIIKVGNGEELFQSQINNIEIENHDLNEAINYKKSLLERYMNLKKENDKLNEVNAQLNQKMIAVLLEEMSTYVNEDEGLKKYYNLKKK